METLSPFPHLAPSSSLLRPPLPNEVLATYQSIFYSRVANGEARPFILPYHLYGLFPVAAYICVPKRHRERVGWWGKGAVLALVWYWQICNMRMVGSRSATNGLAAGLISAWGIVWAATWVWWGDFEKERRVRRGRREGGWERVQDRKIEERGENEYDKRIVDENGKLERNGSTHASVRRRWVEDVTEELKLQERNGYTTAPEFEHDTEGEREYYWQTYPEDLKARMSWVWDLLINFRGPGWSWAIPPLEPLSTILTTADGKPLYEKVPEVKYKRKTFRTRKEMARYRIPQFLMNYLALDAIKTLMMHDPYFLFGPTTYALPPHLSSLSPGQLNWFRQLLEGAGILVSLELIFSLPPMVTLLLPSSSQKHLLVTPPYYPTAWGPVSVIYEKGLSGLWGNWWHQTFRYGFSAPYNWALKVGLLKEGTIAARLAALGCAFGISGFLHAAGSLTTTPHTIPMQGFMFFILQGVGILVQTFWCKNLIGRKKMERVNVWVRRIGNAGFVLWWLHLTGNLLLDEFARTGVWLYEPLPTSFTRGVGLGIEEFGFNGIGVNGGKGLGWDWARFWVGGRWEPVDIRWWNGGRWWEAGVAI